jgi:hypothetical protein
MRNLFDDFMKELAERQRQAEAAARGEHPPAPQDPDEGEAPDVEREPADGAEVPPVAGEGHPPPIDLITGVRPARTTRRRRSTDHMSSAAVVARRPRACPRAGEAPAAPTTVAPGGAAFDRSARRCCWSSSSSSC